MPANFLLRFVASEVGTTYVVYEIVHDHITSISSSETIIAKLQTCVTHYGNTCNNLVKF